MVLTLAIPCRQWFGLQDLITPRHIENMAKIMLGTGLIVAYAYGQWSFLLPGTAVIITSSLYL